MAFDVTFEIKDSNSQPIQNASVVFNGNTILSDVLGVATFTNVAIGSDLPYSVTLVSYVTQSGVVNVVDDNIVKNIVMVSVPIIINEPMINYSIQLNRGYIDFNLDTKISVYSTDYSSVSLDIKLFNTIENKAFDITGKSINLKFKLPDNTFLNKTAKIKDALTGMCYYLLTQSEVTQIGRYLVEVKLIDAENDSLVVGKFSYTVVNPMI